MKSLAYSISLFLLASNISLMAYTTEDGKAVPPLPPPPAANVVCSTSAQFYMAMRTQTSGKTIVLKDGTYPLAPFEPLGIDSSNITIRGESGDPTKVILTGSGFRNCTNRDEEMLVLYNGGFTLANLTITDSRCHGLKIENSRDDNVLLHNVRFINIGERMIKGGSVYDPLNWEIRYCHFENTLVPINDACRSDHDNGDYIAGMDIMNGTNWNVHDCFFKNIKGANGAARGAIFWWRGNRDMTAERNTFITCDRAICFGNPSGDGDVTDGIIRNNFIVKGAYIGIEVDNCAGIKIYNNTVYSADATYARTVQFLSNGTGNEMKNNIIYGQIRYIDGAFPDTSHNAFYSTNTNIFKNSQDENPHLSSSATMVINKGIDLGTNVMDDWDGSVRASIDGQIDIGADEYRLNDAVERGSDMVPDGITLVAGPNPFNPVVTIHTNAHSRASLRVFDVFGRSITDLSSSISHGGAMWDAHSFPSGIYLITLQTEKAFKTIKVTLLK
ncbi:MAG: hypothetical protein A2268_04540 [Candidatus Raymondbacteria bacterium RifOxyA12_full_50_37]|uniref:Secretion system C-terminal sorting domain-containing protein n=1 Tax=Candidatus Raymondbacteria bacterium RIFOXYD12_FULL_49_13 TaxID=1817890 RepID=A0A1F7FGF2_UNCRA|nr:MAG: hypothetical protein A2268_04540 [Candidatus Raymondbacteria bacterium RifOxyA12_full_50_37]OGJ94019.1 MAG: hypothetical protein A2248_11740 [Candidatus Raymondbacteria bacterium RIFOXYA2_FULL_49_16]OGJ96533.1 MAG: hypothetical protein A2487_16195 [Candidatus Raymondbacteria bacterium RifOxyC12_full_50_8]OGJ96845.1 MAG: hypothetical protein A2453_04345 [Candidatus Raymondbacteria bacterium RIFOXYC2_FULL_50_21]OGK05774.1 MAG: hypothetical protein A2519_03175 [Candidatus Raymondbacteria b